LGQLAAISQQQEMILREIALRREPAGMLFPPLHSTAEIQKSLPTGHAALVFLCTSRHTYAFLLNNQRYGYWQIGSTAGLYSKIQMFLRQMGHFDQNAEVGIKELTDQQWKKTGKQILETMLKGSQADFSQPFEELVIVPDGPFWYLPFEALQTVVNKEPCSLISRFRIRYAPTFSLVMTDNRGRKPSAHTAIAVGPMFSRDTETASREAVEHIARVLPGCEALHAPSPAASSIYSTLFDRLIVLADIPTVDAPSGWMPLPGERTKTGNTLGDWLTLPWGGPDEIVLPGYHTASESALKRVVPAAAGNEVFLSVCGLMGSGARTVLLSRWRTGGRTSFDLVREFVQELPHTSPADSFQRAVFLTVDSQLNLDEEPRIKRGTDESKLPKATHPMFWAGYLLVDSGGGPRSGEAPAAKVPPPPKVLPGGANPPAVGPPAVGPPAEPPKPDVDQPAAARKGKAKRGQP
jgi:hypothetical protein